MSRLTVALALAVTGLISAPETTAAPKTRGWASAYAPGVMDEVIIYRFATGLWRTPPPRDWYTAAGAIATNDCRQVGQMLTLIAPDGRDYLVLVADCAGRDSTRWMTENRIVAELDARLWERLTAEHGRPLEVTLR